MVKREISFNFNILFDNLNDFLLYLLNLYTIILPFCSFYTHY